VPVLFSSTALILLMLALFAGNNGVAEYHDLLTVRAALPC
jgi:hypothetical protein